jgi:hypothetical protein
VTFPAYPDSTAGVRSLMASRGVDFDVFSRAIAASRSGGSPASEDAAGVRLMIAALNGQVPPKDEQRGAKAPVRVGLLARLTEVVTA